MEQDQQSFYSRAAASGTATGEETSPARTDTIDQGPRSGAVREALALLLEPGGVAELRAIGRDGRVASGYFDNPALLAATADHLDTLNEYSGCYVTLNPVAPALLARRANRVVMRLGAREATTADADIVRRRWLPVDIDPVRPSGISSTDEERAAALGVAERVRGHLDGLGWPAPVLADSGNGAHLLYRVDLPNDGDATALVKGVLAALDALFSTAAAKVDTANHNAARIWKLYGTVSRKGDSTADRPHRRSAVLEAPPRPAVVPADLLRALAGPAPAAAVPAPAAGGFDLPAWLEAHGIAVASERPWQGGTLYALEQCPFSDAHRDGAYAVRFSSGAVHAGCHHASCGGGRQRWPELRARFDPPVPAPAPAPAEPDAAAVAVAAEVLARGDPLAYLLAAFARDHVGDEILAHCLVMSIASPAVLNSHGLHVYVTGESGKGKSSGMTAMLKQVPEEFCLAERMSNKALYYSDDIQPGTVLLLDDIELSEELQEVLKEATSHFDQPTRHRSVDAERRVRHYAIPERCVWWLATVRAVYDDQVLNRMLTCWVDDSEAQDRAVFRRQLAAEARPAREAVAERTDLAACREIWRTVRATGLVHVGIPFAERIRMASVSNRRNPLVLLDLVRSHALLFFCQRPSERLGDGTLAVTATEEDFAYAARIFCALHAGSGSLGSKFDRNEHRILAEAARREVERFTVSDVQQWTGWTYHRVRRLMMGYLGRGGTRYPGLLDRSPALSLVDQTVVDPDGADRDTRQRRLVFVFDPEIYRETLTRGDVWLADETGDVQPGPSCTPVVTPGVTFIGCRNGGEIGIGPVSGDLSEKRYNSPDHGEPVEGLSAHRVSVPVVTFQSNTVIVSENPVSDQDPAVSNLTTECTTGLHHADCCTSPGPRAFAPLEEPAPEPCDACGRSPTHFREVRPKGGRRYLCRTCHRAAVRRERRAAPPLPGVIEPGALQPVTAWIGSCQACGLEPAAFAGGGVRLCGACFDRETRRAGRKGTGVRAEG